MYRNNLIYVPVKGEEASERIDQAMAFAEYKANGAAKVLVPANQRCTKLHRWPNVLRSHFPHHVLRRMYSLWHIVIWLPILYDFI